MDTPETESDLSNEVAQALKNTSADDMIGILEDAIVATQVLDSSLTPLESVHGLSESAVMLLAGLRRTRSALAMVVYWMGNQTTNTAIPASQHL